MKNISLLAFLFYAIIGLALFGCGQPDPEPEPGPNPGNETSRNYLKVDPKSLTFDEDGGTETIQISASGEWTATVKGTGFSISKDSGKGDATIEVAALPTDSGDDISGSIVLKIGKSLSATVKLTQLARKKIQVGDFMEIPVEGGTFEVDVQYNTDFTVEVEESAQSWITFVKTKALKSGKLVFAVAENESIEPRTGTVTVKDNNGKVQDITLTFSQKAAEAVIAVGDVMEIPAEGGTFEVDVQYNTDFTVEVEESAQSWITFVQTKALTEGKLELRFEPNEDLARSGSVMVIDVNGKVEPITLTFVQQDGLESKIKEILMEIYNAMDGPNWTQQDHWGTDYPLAGGSEGWSGVRFHKETGELTLSFNGMGLKGEIPECIGEFGRHLIGFLIADEPGITGGLPDSFRNLTGLQSLCIMMTPMTFLPDVFGDMNNLQKVLISYTEMSGEIPESIDKSPALESLKISATYLTGGLRASWARLGKGFEARLNCLSGEIPKEFIESPDARHFMSTIMEQRDGYYFDISNIDVPGYLYWPGDPNEIINDLDGNTFSFLPVINQNKYTVYICWAPWCSFSRTMMPLIKDYYDIYHKDGLEIISTVMINEDGSKWTDVDGQWAEVVEKGYDQWYNFYYWSISDLWAHSIVTPIAEVYDSDGNILFSSFKDHPDPRRQRFGKTASSDLIPFLETLLGPADPGEVYTSTDFSMDGQVLTLQTASVGGGINIVFMGDAYTDLDMASGGLYETVMNDAMEEFFAIEPYKTFRNRFNVYAVKAVSTNNFIGEGYSTALSSQFGSGTYVGGDYDKCYEYALKVPDITDEHNLLVCVMVNTRRHAGTASLSESLQSGVAFASSMGNRRDLFGSGLRHEAGGHGFGFLADEYYNYQATTPQSHIDEYNRLYNAYGWYSNVDFTNNPATVRWSAFLSDDRYKNEVGIFEGGALYSLGAYRPSQNSMMRENMEYFNAPSRWAIYKRIMELSGENYSFETFLEYDEVNRGTHASQSSFSAGRKSTGQLKDWQPGAPPVVVP